MRILDVSIQIHNFSSDSSSIPPSELKNRVADVGWHMSNRLTKPIVTEALRKAIESRRPESGTLLHHSDRGCQYTSDAFQEILRKLNIQCSMNGRS